MLRIIIYLIITAVIAVSTLTCAGYQVSYGVGYGVYSGPYGYGGYPRVNVGVYGGGYPRIGY